MCMDDKERINVCYGIFDRNGTYAKIAGTSVCSVFENTEEPVTVHIIHDVTLTERNRGKFQELADIYGQEIQFHDVSYRWNYIWDRIRKTLPQWAGCRCTIGMFFRLVIGDILIDTNRVIYLDCDTIVNMDIRKLWECETSESGLAAVPDMFVQKYGTKVINNNLVPRNAYFNSGVLLIDIRKFRRVKNLIDKVLNFIIKYDSDYPDQDALNYLFPHSAILSNKYNRFVANAIDDKQPVGEYIYHYANNCFGLDMENEFYSLYFSFFTKTPWCDEKFLGNLMNQITAARFEMLSFANKCVGKRRIIIALISAEKIVADILGVVDTDIFIPLEKIWDYNLDFNVKKDMIVAFLKDDDYKLIREKLVSFGLVENVHFVNIAHKIGLADGRPDDYRIFLNS